MSSVQSYPSGVCLHATGVFRAAEVDAATVLDTQSARQAGGVKPNTKGQTRRESCPRPVDAGLGNFSSVTGGRGTRTCTPAASAVRWSSSFASGGSIASLVFGAD